MRNTLLTYPATSGEPPQALPPLGNLISIRVCETAGLTEKNVLIVSSLHALTPLNSLINVELSVTEGYTKIKRFFVW